MDEITKSEFGGGKLEIFLFCETSTAVTVSSAGEIA